jgi:plasmid stability protein
MTNLTISLDEDIIREARVRAIREGTSVSAKIREFLTQYAGQNDAQRQAGEAILAMARSGSYKAEENVKWTKEDANDRYATWPKNTHS